MRKILILLFSILSVAGFSQSNLTNNAVFNLKDSRSSTIWRFAFLNNTDSLYTLDSVGINFIRAARFKAKTTAQRPAYAVAGMLLYNSDSSAFEYYDGGSWQKLSIAAGVSTPTLQQVLTAGSALSSNATITTGTNTFTVNTNSATRIHINASGNVGINGTTTSGYDLHVNGLFGATSGAAGLYFNGTTNLTYAVGSNSATWRIQGDSRYFIHSVSSSGYLFYPSTDNAREYKIQEVGGGNIFGIDFANKLVKLHAVPAATSSDTRLLMRGSSDSALRQLANGTTGQVLTATTGSAPSWAAPSNIYSADGTLSGNRIVSGAESYDINFNTVDTFGVQGNAVYLNPVTNTSIGGAFGLFSKQTITSGTATTITNNVSRVLVNPGSVLASHTITLPASPHDGDEVRIFFGGTIAGGATVVTSLTISANSGQTLMQPTTPSTAVGGDCIIYSHNISNNTWYRIR